MPRVKVTTNPNWSNIYRDGLHGEEYWKKHDKRQARSKVAWVFRDLEDIAKAFHRAGMEEEAKRTVLAIKTLKLIWMRENDKGKFRLVTKLNQSPEK